MSRRSLPAALLLVTLAIVGARCSRESPTATVSGGATTGAGMDIAFSGEATPPTSGDNAFEVTVKKDGTPVEDASVIAVFTMPAMPSMNMPEMRSTSAMQPAGGGRYRGMGQLSMAGTWQVRITVSREGQQLGTKELSIVAR